MTSLSINRAWDETRAFLDADRRLIVPVLLAFMILPAVLYRIAVPAAGDMEAMLAGEGPPAWAGWLGYVLVFISFIGIFTMILLALGRKERLGQVIGIAARRSVTLLLALILLGLLLVPLGIIAVVPFMAGGGVADPAQLTPGALLAVGLVMIAYLMFLFRMFLLFPAVAAEPVGAWRALKRGWALGRGNGLKLIATFGLLLIVSMTISYVINHVGGTVATLILDGDRGLTVGSLLVGLAASSASAVFQAIQAGMLASLYRQATAG